MEYLIKFDKIVKRWGYISLFFFVLVGMGLVWSGSVSFAQTTDIDTIRISEMEKRQTELTESDKATTILLASHQVDIAVIKAQMARQDKQLDTLSGYISWACMGIIGLIGFKAWEHLIPSPKNRATPPSSSSTPLYRV